jgi:hypothetical protein
VGDAGGARPDAGGGEQDKGERGGMVT